ncbi:nucleotidyltransferase family protein [Formosa agariphila KMM 3901]|uniref:Nucleotidyltransferase family protein n=1 Tax=Formosa agariphila (strain DSM 15362 / KCTC 12365 / LMG 23005 / KMM 3901 / M-2Alg 35-1) TaxID=1347342 RepID=T2KN92_FORAG|nr:sugar phosphate nucleotidyltransferase [Formosa agariphila]CDF80332.1 nucleotidyltransferase family protein [Formosa agariphila KMM 3901]
MSVNKPTLVILAAGIGSRYGGLKQLDTFSPEKDTIMDFSIYDALKAGFGKFVFIIRKNIEEEFKAVFNEKLEGRAEVDYVFQELENVPDAYVNPERKKPWGTGHALLMAKDAVTENFAIINADDFYGREAFETMAKALMETDKDSYNFCMMAYLLKNTVSDNGFVSRGECQVNAQGFLTDVTERLHIEKTPTGIIRKDENNDTVDIDGDVVVSMNFWGFTPKCFEFGTKLFETFLEENKHNLKAEFFIPSVVNEILQSGTATVKVLKSDAKWFGVTYKEDKKSATDVITKLKSENVYPSNLWSNDRE